MNTFFSSSLLEKPSPKVKPASTAQEKSDQEEREKNERALFCGECMHLVTHDDQRIEVSGQHAHTFMNRAGYVFQIGVFDGAPGALVIGSLESDYTWFPGYSWRYTNCGGCHNHLGWSFEADDGEGSFLGLVLSRLVDGASTH